MALTESIEYDKIEVVGQYKNVQVRKATVIKRDGVELTRTFERFVLDPGTLDESDNLVDNPLSKEPDGTTDIADTSAGSADKSVSTRLSEASNVPASKTNLEKDLVNSVPSFLITVALRTCTILY